MHPKIRRDVTDPQTPIRIAIIGMSLEVRLQRLDKTPIFMALRLGNRLAIAGGVKVKRVDQIVVSIGVVGSNCDRPAVSGDGVFEAAFVLEDITKFAICLGVIRPERNCPAIGGSGLIKQSTAFQGHPKAEVGFGEIWLKHSCRLMCRDGLIKITLGLERIAQTVVRVGQAGI